MTDLAVIVPSRGRPQNIKRLAEAWIETEAEAELVVCVDDDDPTLDGYREVFNRYDITTVVGPRKRLVPWLNQETLNRALAKGPRPFALGFMGDDHLVKTMHWDQSLVRSLKEMGTGFAYGNDLLMGQNLATAWFMTSDIVHTLGYMIPPCLTHFFADNFICDAGAAIGRLAYLPNVVIEHLHPLNGKALEDGAYRESWAHDGPDKLAYEQYKADGSFAADIEKLKASIS
jgi:hypothetical protein